ncbi:MAG: hypothetical protein A4E71_00317 [Smithella sp. PtaU1.Bin162]|nr:MAG: hypothetical protein A4E71_00317 [Smithella sp. PtaU1.Bin162]
MSESELKRIMINGHLVGIVGLDAAIKKAVQSQSSHDDIAIQTLLLETIAADNYIPAAAYNAYGKALLREFKLVQGLPVEPAAASGLIIAVLGTGCVRCLQMESDLRDILSEMGIAADLRHVSEVQEIARYGVMGLPALVINGKIVAAGYVPPKSDIRKWIIEAYPPPDMKK